MKKPKPKHDSKPHQAAPEASELAAKAVGQDKPTAEASAQALANDQAAHAPSEAATFKDVVAALAKPEFVTLRSPWPADVPLEALKQASIVVRSKAERGRRRAGFAFSRSETVIPFDDLSAAQIAAMTGDAALIVSLRVPKPD